MSKHIGVTNSLDLLTKDKAESLLNILRSRNSIFNDMQLVELKDPVYNKSYYILYWINSSQYVNMITSTLGYKPGSNEYIIIENYARMVYRVMNTSIGNDRKTKLRYIEMTVPMRDQMFAVRNCSVDNINVKNIQQITHILYEELTYIASVVYVHNPKYRVKDYIKYILGSDDNVEEIDKILMKYKLKVSKFIREFMINIIDALESDDKPSSKAYIELYKKILKYTLNLKDNVVITEGELINLSKEISYLFSHAILSDTICKQSELCKSFLADPIIHIKDADLTEVKYSQTIKSKKGGNDYIKQAINEMIGTPSTVIKDIDSAKTFINNRLAYNALTTFAKIYNTEIDSSDKSTASLFKDIINTDEKPIILINAYKTLERIRDQQSMVTSATFASLYDLLQHERINNNDVYTLIHSIDNYNKNEINKEETVNIIISELQSIIKQLMTTEFKQNLATKELIESRLDDLQQSMVSVVKTNQELTDNIMSTRKDINELYETIKANNINQTEYNNKILSSLDNNLKTEYIAEVLDIVKGFPIAEVRDVLSKYYVIDDIINVIGDKLNIGKGPVVLNKLDNIIKASDKLLEFVDTAGVLADESVVLDKGPIIKSNTFAKKLVSVIDMAYKNNNVYDMISNNAVKQEELIALINQMPDPSNKAFNTNSNIDDLLAVYDNKDRITKLEKVKGLLSNNDIDNDNLIKMIAMMSIDDSINKLRNHEKELERISKEEADKVLKASRKLTNVQNNRFDFNPEQSYEELMKQIDELNNKIKDSNTEFNNVLEQYKKDAADTQDKYKQQLYNLGLELNNVNIESSNNKYDMLGELPSLVHNKISKLVAELDALQDSYDNVSKTLATTTEDNEANINNLKKQYEELLNNLKKENEQLLDKVDELTVTELELINKVNIYNGIESGLQNTTKELVDTRTDLDKLKKELDEYKKELYNKTKQVDDLVNLNLESDRSNIDKRTALIGEYEQKIKAIQLQNAELVSTKQLLESTIKENDIAKIEDKYRSHINELKDKITELNEVYRHVKEENDRSTGAVSSLIAYMYVNNLSKHGYTNKQLREFGSYIVASNTDPAVKLISKFAAIRDKITNNVVSVLKAADKLQNNESAFANIYDNVKTKQVDDLFSLVMFHNRINDTDPIANYPVPYSGVRTRDTASLKALFAVVGQKRGLIEETIRLYEQYYYDYISGNRRSYPSYSELGSVTDYDDTHPAILDENTGLLTSQPEASTVHERPTVLSIDNDSENERRRLELEDERRRLELEDERRRLELEDERRRLELEEQKRLELENKQRLELENKQRLELENKQRLELENKQRLELENKQRLEAEANNLAIEDARREYRSKLQALKDAEEKEKNETKSELESRISKQRKVLQALKELGSNITNMENNHVNKVSGDLDRYNNEKKTIEKDILTVQYSIESNNEELKKGIENKYINKTSTEDALNKAEELNKLSNKKLSDQLESINKSIAGNQRLDIMLMNGMLSSEKELSTKTNEFASVLQSIEKESKFNADKIKLLLNRLKNEQVKKLTNDLNKEIDEEIKKLKTRLNKLYILNRDTLNRYSERLDQLESHYEEKFKFLKVKYLESQAEIDKQFAAIIDAKNKLAQEKAEQAAQSATQQTNNNTPTESDTDLNVFDINPKNVIVNNLIVNDVDGTDYITVSYVKIPRSEIKQHLEFLSNYKTHYAPKMGRPKPVLNQTVERYLHMYKEGYDKFKRNTYNLDLEFSFEDYLGFVKGRIEMALRVKIENDGPKTTNKIDPTKGYFTAVRVPIKFNEVPYHLALLDRYKKYGTDYNWLTGLNDTDKLTISTYIKAFGLINDGLFSMEFDEFIRFLDDTIKSISKNNLQYINAVPDQATLNRLDRIRINNNRPTASFNNQAHIIQEQVNHLRMVYEEEQRRRQNEHIEAQRLREAQYIQQQEQIKRALEERHRILIRQQQERDLRQQQEQEQQRLLAALQEQQRQELLEQERRRIRQRRDYEAHLEALRIRARIEERERTRVPDNTVFSVVSDTASDAGSFIDVADMNIFENFNNVLVKEEYTDYIDNSIYSIKKDVYKNDMLSVYDKLDTLNKQLIKRGCAVEVKSYVLTDNTHITDFIKNTKNVAFNIITTLVERYHEEIKYNRSKTTVELCTIVLLLMTLIVMIIIIKFNTTTFAESFVTTPYISIKKIIKV